MSVTDSYLKVKNPIHFTIGWDTLVTGKSIILGVTSLLTFLHNRWGFHTVATTNKQKFLNLFEYISYILAYIIPFEKENRETYFWDNPHACEFWTKL